MKNITVKEWLRYDFDVKPYNQRANGVSCVCLTYGRPELLEESIESFLRQDWVGPKELIIVNDHPEQQLKFDHPEVTVFNIPRRLRTLGEKRNLSVSLTKWDNILVWDDDDIYLPWRITETMKTLPTAQFYKCPNAWVLSSDVWQEKPGFNLYHGGTAYTRWLFDVAGGYRCINGGEDCDIEWRFQNVTEKKGEYWPHTTLPLNRLYYVYRWGHGHYHATGHNNLDDINPQVVKGQLTLSPHWRIPYDTLAIEKAAEIEKANKS